MARGTRFVRGEARLRSGLLGAVPVFRRHGNRTWTKGAYDAARKGLVRARTLRPMSGLVTSIENTLPKQYRARAQQARERAAAVPDGATRKRLLQDADTWERMADYEEEANPGG